MIEGKTQAENYIADVFKKHPRPWRYVSHPQAPVMIMFDADGKEVTLFEMLDTCEALSVYTKI